MSYAEYYSLFTRLVEEFPEFYGKSEYTKICTVDTNPLKYELEEIIKFSPVYDSYLEARAFYDGKEILSYVEDFYVKSYLGGDVFLASFSDTGVSEKQGEGFITKAFAQGIIRSVFSHDDSSSRDIAAAVWSDVLTSNPKMRKTAARSSENDLFKTEIKILNPEEHWTSIDGLKVSHTLDLLSNQIIDKLVVDNVVKNFWQWNEAYYYGDLTQTYRFLLHPKLKPNNILDRMYDLNTQVAKNSSFKNPVLSLNMCVSRNEKESLLSAGLTLTGCRACGSNGMLYPVRSGAGIRPTLLFCSSCLNVNNKIIIEYIRKAADGIDGLNPYSVLLKDLMYGVITEEQLISMAYDFPELREEIMSAKNATENVNTVFAFTKNSLED